MNTKFNEPTISMAEPLTRRAGLKKFTIGLAGVALMAGALCVTGFGQKHYQLGGAWVGGHPGFQWSAIQAPMDPLGQTCATRPISNTSMTRSRGCWPRSARTTSVMPWARRA